MSISKPVLCFITIVALTSYGCNSFRYGYTQSLAYNSYNLITDNKSSFGNRRIKYNIGHHTNTALSNFLKQRGKPDFIYEYEEEKRDGINLYYVQVDSVYLFKEAKKNNPRSSVFTTARSLSELEKLTYKDLLEKAAIKK